MNRIMKIPTMSSHELNNLSDETDNYYANIPNSDNKYNKLRGVDKPKSTFESITSIIREDNVDELKNLLNSGEISVQDIVGESKGTYLHLAALYDAASVIIYLLSKGADINICNKNKETALLIAVRMRNNKSVQVLLKNKGRC